MLQYILNIIAEIQEYYEDTDFRSTEQILADKKRAKRMARYKAYDFVA